MKFMMNAKGERPVSRMVSDTVTAAVVAVAAAASIGLILPAPVRGSPLTGPRKPSFVRTQSCLLQTENRMLRRKPCFAIFVPQ